METPTVTRPTSLFLDDERFPPEKGGPWAIVRSVEAAIAWVEANGWPDRISFDNDLGEGMQEGWRFAQWLIERDLDRGDMPEDFDFFAHSRNPVRQADIEGRLRAYMAYRAARCSDP